MPTTRCEKESGPAIQVLRRLQPAVCLAKEVVALLG